MSGAKEEFYKPFRETARGAGRFGDSIGWDWLENESKRNKDNPGRALGKSLGYAAGYMTGTYLASGMGAAAGAASGAGEGAAGMSPEITAGLLSQIPAEAGSSAIAPELLMHTQGAATPAAQTSLNAAPKIARGLMSGGGDKVAMQKFAMQQGLQMMQPPPQQPMQPGRPMQQPEQQPMPMPYGTPAGNSLGIPQGMSYAEWLKRKQAGLI